MRKGLNSYDHYTDKYGSSSPSPFEVSLGNYEGVRITFRSNTGSIYTGFQLVFTTGEVGRVWCAVLAVDHSKQ